jgi:hypothetical protein
MKRTKSKAKSKAKTSSRKRNAGAVEKVIPNHLQQGATFVMGLHDVIKVVKMIEQHDLLTKFTREMKKEQAEVRIPAHTVNLVKDFVAENGLHKNAIGKHIVNARQKNPLEDVMIGTANVVATDTAAAEEGDPNRCNFGHVEH